MDQLTEARCRWLIRQEMRRLRDSLGDAVVDDNFADIHSKVEASLAKSLAQESLPPLPMLKMLIRRAVDAIEKALSEHLRAQETAHGENQH